MANGPDQKRSVLPPPDTPFRGEIKFRDALPGVTAQGLTTQRKPRWQVDVSSGCAIRAAGR
jgi:hypothetical protein